MMRITKIAQYCESVASMMVSASQDRRIVRDRRLAPMPDGAIGRALYGHTQLDYFSCGAAAAFTVVCAKQYVRTGTMPALSEYEMVMQVVRPEPESGSTWQDVNRVLHGRYGRLRAVEVRKRLQEGNIVVAAVWYPTEDAPDLQHFVVITATADDQWLCLNKPGKPGFSHGWHDWAWVRERADDQCLVVSL